MRINNRATRDVFFRAVTNHRFRTFCTAIVEEDNRRLSWFDVGIWFFVMSRGPGWQLHMNDLLRRKSDRQYSIMMSMKRLRAAGYCQLVQVRKQGKVRGWRYDFFDMPLAQPQVKAVIENYDKDDKLIMQESDNLPDIRKPHSGEEKTSLERDFPQVRKPHSGDVLANSNENNKNGTANSNANYKDILYQKNILKEKDIVLIDESLGLVARAAKWWAIYGASIFQTSRGFCARELGRYELQQIGEQLQVLTVDDLTARYAAYHTLTDRQVVDTGYNIWSFINRLDRLGMMTRNTQTVTEKQDGKVVVKKIEDMTTEEFVKKFGVLS